MHSVPPMPGIYPEIEPLGARHARRRRGNAIYWETCGADEGKPAVVVHGGPGSGCTPWHRRLFDPAAYRTVLFDQRGAGRSRPHAGDPATSMEANTTPHLVADMELLRLHLGVERWLLLGGSWGSTLALAYAAAHPDRVTDLVLFGVTTGRRSEDDWLFREGLAPMFPAQWARRREAVPTASAATTSSSRTGGCWRAATPTCASTPLEWCVWESVTPSWPPATASPPLRGRNVPAGVRADGHPLHRPRRVPRRGRVGRGIDPPAGVPGVLVTAASTCRRRSAPHGACPPLAGIGAGGGRRCRAFGQRTGRLGDRRGDRRFAPGDTNFDTVRT